MQVSRKRPGLAGCILFLAATLMLLAGSDARGQSPPGVTVAECTEQAFRSAIANAEPGATITFGCDGTITLTEAGGDTPINVFKDLTIDGTGRDVTISGGDQVAPLNTASQQIVLRNLTFRDGKAARTLGGGAVYNQGGLLVDNVDFLSNSAGEPTTSGGSGGAIHSFGALASLEVKDSSFADNTVHCGGLCAFGGGGAIAVQSGGLTKISGSTFERNSTTGRGNGGAVVGRRTFSASRDGAIEISGSTFKGNLVTIIANDSTLRNGGGAVASANHDLTISQSTFEENSAGFQTGAPRGGAVLLFSATGNEILEHKTGAITNSAFTGNTAENGGAVTIADAPTSISGSTLQGNRASTGGAISNEGAPLAISGSQITGNEANGAGDPVAGGVKTSGVVSFSGTQLLNNVSGNCGVRGNGDIKDLGSNSESPGTACGFNSQPRVEALNTFITEGPNFEGRRARFEYEANRSNVAFQCRVTKTGNEPRAFRPCPSGTYEEGFPEGDYRFEVRAVDGEEVDATPSSRDFTMPSGVDKPAQAKIKFVKVEGNRATARFTSKTRKPGETFRCGIANGEDEDPPSHGMPLCEPDTDMVSQELPPGDYRFWVYAFSASATPSVTSKSFTIEG